MLTDSTISSIVRRTVPHAGQFNRLQRKLTIKDLFRRCDTTDDRSGIHSLNMNTGIDHHSTFSAIPVFYNRDFTGYNVCFCLHSCFPSDTS